MSVVVAVARPAVPQPRVRAPHQQERRHVLQLNGVRFRVRVRVRFRVRVRVRVRVRNMVRVRDYGYG